MRRQSFPFSAFHDELLTYLVYFLDERDLIRLSCVNALWYVFCTEEPVWMNQCLRLHGGEFTYGHSWRTTCFWPREKHCRLSIVPIAGFYSEFLYRRWYRCNVSLNQFVFEPHVSKTIRYFTQSELQRDNLFQRCYLNLPVMIQDALYQWKASEKWSIQQFIHRFESSEIQFRITHNLSTDTVRMSFNNYAQYLQVQRDETPLYIFDAKFGDTAPELVNEYDVESLQLFTEDFLGLVASRDRPDFRWLVVGPERSGAPWHIDPTGTSAWNALLQGRKRWALYPPGIIPPGVVLDDNEDISGLTSLRWYLEIYPTLSEMEKPLEMIQNPGEVIYVPSGWWHMVLNIEATLAVTQNFVDSNNLSSFCHDLIQSGDAENLFPLQQALARTYDNKFNSWFSILFDTCENGFGSVEEHLESFQELTPEWRMAIDRVCQRHKLPIPAELDTTCVCCGKTTDSLTVLTKRVNPTFAVGTEVIVKFFSQYDHWNGMECPYSLDAMLQCYKNEVWAYHLLEKHPKLQKIAPKLYGKGYLYRDRDMNPWPWPYVLVSHVKDVVSLRQVLDRGELNAKVWEKLIEWLSSVVLPGLHSIKPVVESKDPWSQYRSFLLKRRETCIAAHYRRLFSSIPWRLLLQLESYLPDIDSIDDLIPDFQPVFLHGDLTDENILGRLDSSPIYPRQSLRPWLESIGFGQYSELFDREELDQSNFHLLSERHLEKMAIPLGPRLELLERAQNGGFRIRESREPSEEIAPLDWTPKHLVDFGDAKCGDPLYDFIALYFSVFKGRKELFQQCVSMVASEELSYRAMCLTILHPSSALSAVFQYFPQAKAAENWNEVANLVYNM